jgi:hypothetical protein
MRQSISNDNGIKEVIFVKIVLIKQTRLTGYYILYDRNSFLAKVYVNMK